MKIALRDIRVDLPLGGKTLFHLPRFEVAFRKKILIRGESGRGKTTLLHLIAGLFDPSEGQVEIGEKNLNKMNDEERCHFRRQNIGIIFQKLNLLEHLTAAENIALALNPKAEHTAKIAQALNAVGLMNLAGERSSRLSLGEQQRIAVARVLAAEGKIILADEPTSSLDERNAINVMDLLFSAATDRTLIVVSHDQRLEKKFDQVFNFAELVNP